MLQHVAHSSACRPRSPAAHAAALLGSLLLLATWCCGPVAAEWDPAAPWTAPEEEEFNYTNYQNDFDTLLEVGRACTLSDGCGWPR